MMKQIFYFISIVLASALCSCSGQYDNIDQYATDETVYIGRFSDYPYVLSGYKRVEIELLGDTVGRISSDNIYMGKAKKTVVEYEESEGVRRIEFDSVCSWVNVTGLTIAKTYIFKIYAEDEEGHRSIPVEALGKPFTDEDLAGFAFPQPHVIPTPTTVEFVWGNATGGLNTSLYNFVELTYSYLDVDNKMVSGSLTARQANDNPSFSISNLKFGEETYVTINCRLIPKMDARQILDTISMISEIVTATVDDGQYLAERTLRQITSAMINPTDLTKATITLGEIPDHLKWTEIQYKKTTGEGWHFERVNNETSTVECTDISRYDSIQIRCTYNPPGTTINMSTEWTNCDPFVLKYDRLDWVVLPDNVEHPWGTDGAGSQETWRGGHPMLIIDDDLKSGWHSYAVESVPCPELPQVIIIDMKEERTIFRVDASGNSYWKTVELYLTNELSIPDGYESHNVNWGEKIDMREQKYDEWLGKYFSTSGSGVELEFITRIPKDKYNTPASWGLPIAKGSGEEQHSFILTQELEGRFLILRFPDNTIWTPTYPATYIGIFNVDVYTH